MSLPKISSRVPSLENNEVNNAVKNGYDAFCDLMSEKMKTAKVFEGIHRKQDLSTPSPGTTPPQ